MNVIFFSTVLMVLGAPQPQVSESPSTQLYVKTTPPGAAVLLDGKLLGQSDKLFPVPAGSHKLVVELEGYAADERSIEVRDGQIVRVEVELKRRPGDASEVGYVDDSAEGTASLADSGHAVELVRPNGMRSVSAVQLFATRYGYPEAPKDDFHLYLLDESRKVLEHVRIPYGKVERGEARWYRFEFPAVAVPENFFVAFWFNAEATKGIRVGMDKNVRQTHSYVGLPDKGYEKVDQAYDWMIRAVVSAAEGKKPSYPKIVTYEEQKVTDTESHDALPLRTWSDSTGAFSVDAELAGVEQGQVNLKRPDGKVIAVPLDRLSKEDQEFVAQYLREVAPGKGAGEPRELALDDGKKSGQASIAGGGHAVRFTVDGEGWYVTSVRLHGARYGMPKPPKENFRIWICDEQFKPIATFQFPYASFARGEAVWKPFRVKPTRVPPKFIICLGFNPEATKGVFVSYDAEGSGSSLVGIPGSGDAKPYGRGDWLIRCTVEKR